MEFGKVSTVLKLAKVSPRLNSTNIQFIQQDRSNPANIIFAIPTAIFLLPITGTRQPTLVAGDILKDGYREGVGSDAWFDGISGIVQTTSGYVVTDSWNNCIRMIQPNSQKSWNTVRYAGKCTMPGSEDGRRLSARFSHPNGLIKQGNNIYIADTKAKTIRKLDMDTESVTTIHRSEALEPKRLVLGKTSEEFYVTADHGILQIQASKETWLVGSATSSIEVGKKPFSAARFSYPLGITWLGANFLLVADQESDSIKVVDLYRQRVESICSGKLLIQHIRKEPSLKKTAICILF